MANTYSRILIHIVFAVHARQTLIKEENREDLQRYITGIITKRNQKCLAIFCMPDHTHILIGMNPDIAVSDLVRDIKAASTNHINRSGWSKIKFNWQTGFSAFSYAKSQLSTVVAYINNQPTHHRQQTFKQEYIGLLTKFDVDYDEKYLFEFDD